MTGRQTAIYPQARPGGWNLIGRTPLVIVDVADGFFPLRVGDRVRFERIDERRYPGVGRGTAASPAYEPVAASSDGLGAARILAGSTPGTSNCRLSSPAC